VAGADPTHGNKLARLRGKKNSVKLGANAELDRKQVGEIDPAIFENEIWPKLGEVSLIKMMRATGLSRTYCGLIRRGVKIPHPRHWGGVLRELL
jgi:hypothetical protein